MEKKWEVKKNEVSFDEELVKKYGKTILGLLHTRGVRGEKEIESFFNFTYEKDVSDPFLFPDMQKAVERIIRARKKEEKIAVFGDYDADGVTATAVIIETLKKLDFKNVIPYIPDRQIEGYGMNVEAVKFLHREKVSLIITVDCGISNNPEIEKAKELGIDVIVTDHHHIPIELPKALAIINPHLENSVYPFKELAGVGVAFKLAQALYQKIDREKAEQLKWALDLVAIGTVADCVPLLGENRVLVKYGLVVLSKTRRSGLLEMFKVGRIMIDENNFPDTQKIAFQISPRINAAGRMDHASISYELLTENDNVKARDMALEIENKNQQRQKVTAEIVREIKTIAENSFRDKKFIFVTNEHWPVGILGLVAGKIADEYHKPVAVLQKQAKEFVGSLRSVPEVNIVEAIEKCSDLVVRFGGHSQAAGVKVSHEKIEKFYEKLAGIIEKELAGKDPVPLIEIDSRILAEEINWELLLELKKMEPFGDGNEEPLFLLEKAQVEDLKVVGNGSKHLKISLRGQNGNPKIFDSIGFGMGDRFPGLKNGDRVDIVFNLREDEWNGNKKIQLRIEDMRKI